MENKTTSKNNKSKKSRIIQKAENEAEKQEKQTSNNKKTNAESNMKPVKAKKLANENKQEELTKQNQKLQKNDFIELEFTGSTSTGEVFDTNIKEDAQKVNPDFQPKPMVICLGQAMILPAIDEFLIGKSLGKYTLELQPQQAFGLRNPKLIKTMPISVFQKQETIPQPGMVFQFDNVLAKVSAVSGGRVIVDFNNPLAGKEVIYELDAKKKITNLDEKIKSLIYFFFRQDLKYELKDKALTITSPAGFEEFVLLFKDKFKEILDLELEVKVEEKTKPKQEKEKTEEEKQKRGEKAKQEKTKAKQEKEKTEEEKQEKTEEEKKEEKAEKTKTQENKQEKAGKPITLPQEKQTGKTTEEAEENIN